MSMDLIVSDKGDVMIASNHPFPADITRVDFHARKKLLMINYTGNPDAELLNLEVHDRLMSALLKAPSIMVVEVAHNRPVKGFSVPLVQTEFAP